MQDKGHYQASKQPACLDLVGVQPLGMGFLLTIERVQAAEVPWALSREKGAKFRGGSEFYKENFD